VAHFQLITEWKTELPGWDWRLQKQLQSQRRPPKKQAAATNSKTTSTATAPARRRLAQGGGAQREVAETGGTCNV